jgi:hypothetical protein
LLWFMKNKWRLYGGFLLVTSLLGGAYGAVHDQLSYFLSPEYFTHFKFAQFGLQDWQESPRWAAAWVGFLASVWVAALVALVLGALASRSTTAPLMAAALLRALCWVLAGLLGGGACGLVYGYFAVTPATVAHFSDWVWPGVQNPVAFLRVGIFHNASYLGAGVGWLAGMVSVWASFAPKAAVAPLVKQ